MIGSLRGKLTFKQAPAIIIECNGVGYDVETPMSTFFELPGVGEELFLFTHLLVREDAQILYGFATDEERRLFRTLLKVRGIGAKIGLAVLSAMSVASFNRCIEYEDTVSLSKIPGIGNSLKQRVVFSSTIGGVWSWRLGSRPEALRRQACQAFLSTRPSGRR